MSSFVKETQEHIKEVRKLLDICVTEIQFRAEIHDQSKLEEPELSGFSENLNALKSVTYGSPEYKDLLSRMKPTIDHHYQSNRHHPEHFESGVLEMDLMDVLEMVMDWIASSKRTSNGDPLKSLQVNKERFSLDAQLESIIKNTIIRLTARDE